MLPPGESPARGGAKGDDYSAVKNLIGRMEGVLRYEHHVPQNFTNYWQYLDYFAVSAEMPENYQASLDFIQPVIDHVGMLATDRERVEYFNDYIRSLELALEIAKEFAAEYLADYEVVIGTHVDKGHIHSHLVFNSVNAQTGEKYHVSTQEYYRQIRAISERLCREHGLSVIMEGQPVQAVSYIKWLRQSRGQPTFRFMLEADLRTAIEDANDLGHFFMLMEHMGYEISHGNRLGFRLRGQERFMIPGWKNPLFTEEGIQAAILGNLEEIEAGRRPAVIPRSRYRPYKKHPKYTGLMALYVHYLYVLGKIEKRQYPPKMTVQMRKDV